MTLTEASVSQIEINLSKHVTYLGKCFTSEEIFFEGIRRVCASPSQNKKIVGQAVDVLKQVFHKSISF